MKKELDRIFDLIELSTFSLTYLSKFTGIPYPQLRKYSADRDYSDMKLSTFLKLYTLGKVFSEPINNVAEFEVAYRVAASGVDFPNVKLPDGNLSKIDPLLYEVLALVMKIGGGSEKSIGTLMSVRDHLLSGLNDEEYAVVTKRCSLNSCTFAEIGNEMGVTKQRAEQLYNRAIDRLRDNPSVMTFITAHDMLRRELDETKLELNKLRTSTGTANVSENDYPIGALGVRDKRLRDYFSENKIHTVGDLLKDFSVMRMKDSRNIGIGTIETLQKLLITKGFRPLREY